MNVSELVDALESLGVQLWEESGQLHFRAPSGVITEERRKALRDRKQAGAGRADDAAQLCRKFLRRSVEMRHRAHLLQEEIAAATAEATNRNLHALAILTALFLPPTLVTGIFGMNTKGLPFSDIEEAFLWAAAIMASSAVAVYLLMRRIGVFKL